MCGITGIFDCGGYAEIDRALLRRMTDAVRHRGPDGEGFYHAPGIGLGHRRLAIIDLAGGVQPLFNEDRTVCVVFNGEIYNFQPLIAELTACGHVFRTRSDTEVIVHAWEEWGEACLDRFNGMFAFALWDSRSETLFLARDRLGEKPLYYVNHGGLLLFASELKSLLCHPHIDRGLDPQAVEEFFAFGYIPDPRSIYRGIRKLMPGHCLKVKRGQKLPEPRAYWELQFTDGGPATEDEVAEELMAGLNKDNVSTFSMRFQNKGWDESAYAGEMARRYRTDHHLKTSDPNSIGLINRLATIYDEPFGDSSALPTLQVCAMARENVTVALSGDGGDEVFAGYRRYRWQCLEHSVRRFVPDIARRPLFGLFGSIYPKLDWAPRPLRAKTTLQALASDPVGAYFSSVSICNDQLRRSLFSTGFQRELQGYNAIEVLRRHMAQCDSEDPLSQAQFADFRTYLPGDILTKVDRASMANSLEVRVPLLDHTLVEWAARLPPSLKLHGGKGKYVFKRALEPYVSSEILHRPKQGFAVPLAEWYRGPLRDQTRALLKGPVLQQSGLFDGATITRLLDQHEAGIRNHAPVIWMLSMFESFLQKVHGATADPAIVAA